eukprot:TRINITY_DN9928_c0_g1_i4.p1 TRINITY_DN9928_c0_g1~~TRINITY_DN9928_c0_g1_i4.p1  ORF type:complete len:414 (+),score=102.47 TRINITY_DN9928_c0_g1_i4:155-1396(+)
MCIRDRYQRRVHGRLQSLDIQQVDRTKLQSQGEEFGNKEVRTKLKDIMKRNIELEESVEQLTNELRFREQQTKIQGFLEKKSGQNIQQEELKRQYQKQVQDMYETKITKLAKNIKELKQRNQELQTVQKMISSNLQLKNQGVNEEQQNESTPSLSLQSIQNYDANDKSQEGVNGALNLQKNYEIIQDQEIKTMKKKLAQQTNKEIELQNKIDQLQMTIERIQQQNHYPADKKWEQNLQNMKKEYNQIVTQLSNKNAEQEVENIQLSQISSNVQSVLSSSDYDVKSEDLRKIDSNISLSQRPQKEAVDMSKMSSNIQSVLNSQKDLNYNQQELNDVSSRISDISGVNQDNKLQKYSSKDQENIQQLQNKQGLPQDVQFRKKTLSSNISKLSENDKNIDLNEISSNISKISGLEQ